MDIEKITHRQLNYLSRLAWLYLTFLVVVSCLPFKVEPLTLAEAYEHAWTHSPFAIDSYSAWISNLLLFLPLPFLFAASNQIIGIKKKHSYQILLFTLGFFVLTLLIEFLQLFIQTRTSAANDVVAEMFGVLCGWLLWWRLRIRFYWLLTDLTERFYGRRFRSYLLMYLGVLIVFYLYPLDITINPIELYRKLIEGRLVLMPFHQQLTEQASWWSLVANAILWLPVSYLLAKDGLFTRFQIVIRTFFLALTILLFQFFIYSRTTDVSDLLLAVLGATIVVVIFPRLDVIDVVAENKRSRLEKHIFLYLTGLLAASLIFISVFVFPYSLTFESEHIKPAIPYFFTNPFTNVDYAKSFFAIEHLFWQVALAVPFGLITALFTRRVKASVYYAVQYSLLALIFAIFVALEIVQIAVPQQTATLFDAGLSWLAAVLVCLLTNYSVSKMR
ncbi:VanZ family protein [Gayadomonas joobiniege]|uniref:VanZ family protein n=1 Tax=Gayadomonas joobiniege TaxID=1234606 RepID=UPI00036772E2|nr:VanZ family protein [Gayadomonas joobiniege]